MASPPAKEIRHQDIATQSDNERLCIIDRFEKPESLNRTDFRGYGNIFLTTAFLGKCFGGSRKSAHLAFPEIYLSLKL